MAFDFPNAPTTNQIVTAPDGTLRRWDGVKWVAGVTPTTPVAIVGDTPPSNPTPGTMWWDSVGCQMYVYFNDGNSSQWVLANNNPSGALAEAPTDGNQYARSNQQWIVNYPSQGNAGRNLIHNPYFNIQQRGTGPFAVGMTLDRWATYQGGSGDTSSIQPAILDDSTRAAIGDEYAKYCFYNNFTGGSAANNCVLALQNIEDIRRLSGKTVIVSFWATCGSGALKLGVSIDQNFGTGGSPSATINGTGQSVTLSTTPRRYSLTFVLPSASGKTLGTNNDHCHSLDFWYSAGSSSASRAGNIGVQASGIIWLWGVQLEIAAPNQTLPTPLEHVDPGTDLRNCQRFYQTGAVGSIGYVSGTAAIGLSALFPVAMRAAPTVTPGTLTVSINCSGTFTADNATAAGFRAWIASGGAGNTQFLGPFTASADL